MVLNQHCEFITQVSMLSSDSNSVVMPGKQQMQKRRAFSDVTNVSSLLCQSILPTFSYI